MIKFYLFSILIFFSINSFAQRNDITNDGNVNHCLFGYISEDSEEYNMVLEYMKDIGLTVVSNCDEERLIYVQLNNKYRDYTDLFALIEKRFMGTCYYKSMENKIPRYNKCKDQYIKEIAEK